MPPEAVAEIGERWQKIAADVASAICPAHVLSLSVGKATYPDDGGDAETLLAAADRSLYAMKRSRPGMARAQAAK